MEWGLLGMSRVTLDNEDTLVEWLYPPELTTLLSDVAISGRLSPSSSLLKQRWFTGYLTRKGKSIFYQSNVTKLLNQ